MSSSWEPCGRRARQGGREAEVDEVLIFIELSVNRCGPEIEPHAANIITKTKDTAN